MLCIAIPPSPECMCGMNSGMMRCISTILLKEIDNLSDSLMFPVRKQISCTVMDYVDIEKAK